MISTKKLIKMAKKWQQIAAASRRRISWARPVAEKGHFVVYTSDKKRFMIPLAYLKSEIIRELFRIAEEEFGTATSGPIMLPCDSNFMDYIISMIQRHIAEDLEKALIMSLANCRYSSLKSKIFTEFLKMAEEEFEVSNSGPIMLPCNSDFMEYAISMIQRCVAEDLEKALIMFLASDDLFLIPKKRGIGFRATKYRPPTMLLHFNQTLALHRITLHLINHIRFVLSSGK